MQETLVTIDPGSITGWAVFRRGKLIACGYAKAEKCLKIPPWEEHWAGSTTVIEIPQMYPTEKEESPNSILKNGILGGRYLGQADRVAAEVFELTPPRKWKGTIGKPKSVKQQYIIEIRVLRRLDVEETRLIKQTRSARSKGPYLNHNVVDAVGIGLWWLEYQGVRIGKIIRTL